MIGPEIVLGRVRERRREEAASEAGAPQKKRRSLFVRGRAISNLHYKAMPCTGTQQLHVAVSCHTRRTFSFFLRSLPFHNIIALAWEIHRECDRSAFVQQHLPGAFDNSIFSEWKWNGSPATGYASCLRERCRIANGENMETGDRFENVFARAFLRA